MSFRTGPAMGSVAVLAGTLVVLELFLRLPWSPVASPPAHELDDPQSLIGIDMVPGAREHWHFPCHDWIFGVNSEGWRDREHTAVGTRPVRIAVLGDSYMAGAGVDDPDIFARQLETLLGEDDVEVYNFGLTSIGTVQEEILLRERVVPELHPDIVIIGFYANDVMNNDPVLEGGPDRRTRLTYRSDTGALVTYHRPVQSGYALRRFLREHSALFRLVKLAYGNVRAALKVRESITPEGLPDFYEVFGVPKTPAWVRAWSETERALLRIRESAGTGTQLFLMVVPDPLQVSTDPSALVFREFAKHPPSGFDPGYVHRRIDAFAAGHGMGTIDALSAFIAYRDAHQLAYPYFSYTCDAHWNPLGHRLAAETAAAALEPSIAAILSQRR